MDVSTGLGDSDWFRERFGDAAPAVAEALIRAGHHAHNTASDTKATSGLRTDEPYGATFWQVLALTIIRELAHIPGLLTVRPAGSRFDIPVINGTTVYAAKCSTRSGRSAGTLRMGWSHFRDDLLHNVERVPAERLPFGDWDNETDGPARPSSVEDAVVLTAYVASDGGGLERIFIGDGYLDADGNVIWAHCEALPVDSTLDAVNSAPRPFAPRFDDAPMADLPLSLREESEAVVDGP